MTELIAQGERTEDRWRRQLTDGETVVLGRGEEVWSIPWDKAVSRRHAELTWQSGRLRVHRLPTCRNPLFFRGKEDNNFDLNPGEFFVVGRTTLSLRAVGFDSTPDSKAVVQSRTIRAGELEHIPFRDAPLRIDVLRRLPNVISSAPDDRELLQQLVTLLLAGIPRAGVVAVVAATPGDGAGTPVQVLHWDHRPAAGDSFRPSHRLVLDALQRQRDTVVHVWPTGGTGQTQQYTLQGNFDWAFCTPVRGEACQGWGLYVAGQLEGDATATLMAPWSTNELRDDLKFAELVAAIVSALRHTQWLQRRQAVLSHFFSPAMLPVLTGTDPEKALKPRQAEVTVLFCDLRGFARKVETASADLFALLERVSRALGVMTKSILENQGVIADFQGDAAMGFWGWPEEQPNRVALACRAALGIRTLFEEFARQSDHPLAGFQAGIGIATGVAVAGQIGPPDQAKVTVFGPVVNLASRLEGMTKLLRVPILLDETTARQAPLQLPTTEARCRRLALVRPFGLETAVQVTELLPPAGPNALLTDEHLKHYEIALDAFLKGDWALAYEELHLVSPQDHGKDVLLGQILRYDHTPPPGWNGVILLESKS